MPGLELQQTQLIVDNDQTRRISGFEPAFGKCTIAMLEKAKNNLKTYFSVVGVTDRFDEMVVLLKRKFGWESTHKFWPGNIRLERTEKLPIDEKIMEKIRDMNRFDLALYDYVHQMMDDAIEETGGDFERDMRIFQSHRTDIMKRVGHENPKEAKRVEAHLRRVKRDSRL